MIHPKGWLSCGQRGQGDPRPEPQQSQPAGRAGPSRHLRVRCFWGNVLTMSQTTGSQPGVSASPAGGSTPGRNSRCKGEIKGNPQAPFGRVPEAAAVLHYLHLPEVGASPGAWAGPPPALSCPRLAGQTPWEVVPGTPEFIEFPQIGPWFNGCSHEHISLLCPGPPTPSPGDSPSAKPREKKENMLHHKQSAGIPRSFSSTTYLPKQTQSRAPFPAQAPPRLGFQDTFSF